jgi:hypothetical protein
MHRPLAPADLPETWRARAVKEREVHALAQAATFELCAHQLAEAIRQHTDECLSLQQAADESGYSVDHLGRLLREGKIPNSGRTSKPLIRRHDLPVKRNRRKARPCASPSAGYPSDRLFRDIIHSKYGGDDAQD